MEKRRTVDAHAKPARSPRYEPCAAPSTECSGLLDLTGMALRSALPAPHNRISYLITPPGVSPRRTRSNPAPRGMIGCRSCRARACGARCAGLVASDRRTRAGLRRPRRRRHVGEVETVLARGDLGHHRLEKDVDVGPGDETEHGDDRPGEHARLPSGQEFDGRAPALEAGLVAMSAVKETAEPQGELARARPCPHGVTQGHLPEREQEVRPRLDAERAARDFGMLASPQERAEQGWR